MLWLAFACVTTPSTTPSTTAETDETVTETTPPSTSTGTRSPPTGTTPPTEPCPVDPKLVVSEVNVSQPWHENELQLDLVLSSPAAVAVACTLDSDPTEVHLAESGEELTEHALRMAGLLADSDYSCVAAGVCPATAAPFAFAVHTGAPPPGLPPIAVDAPGAHGDEYILVNQSDDCTWQYQRLLVVDRDGAVRWWYATPQYVGPSVDFQYHGGGLFSWGGGWGPNSNGRPRTMDLFDGELFDSGDAMADVGSSAYHHDGKRLSDGRLLTLEQEWVDDGAGGGFDGFRVRRVDPVTNTVDFDYHSQRAYDEGHLPGGSGDAWHANWVDVVDETLYVSLCFLSRVIAIDVATGDWVWTFGPDRDFTLLDPTGAELTDDEFTECQHGLEMTADDRLLVYDNGSYRGVRDYSRATAYQLDTAAMTATQLWTWTEPDWFETTLGSVDELPSGNVLIGAGHAECFSSNPNDKTTVLEIDPASGDKVWELRYDEEDIMAYRADFADPCSLFGNARYCASTADRLSELAPVLGP